MAQVMILLGLVCHVLQMAAESVNGVESTEELGRNALVRCPARENSRGTAHYASCCNVAEKLHEASYHYPRTILSAPSLTCRIPSPPPPVHGKATARLTHPTPPERPTLYWTYVTDFLPVGSHTHPLLVPNKIFEITILANKRDENLAALGRVLAPNQMNRNMLRWTRSKPRPGAPAPLAPYRCHGFRGLSGPRLRSYITTRIRCLLPFPGRPPSVTSRCAIWSPPPIQL